MGPGGTWIFGERSTSLRRIGISVGSHSNITSPSKLEQFVVIPICLVDHFNSVFWSSGYVVPNNNASILLLKGYGFSENSYPPNNHVLLRASAVNFPVKFVERFEARKYSTMLTRFKMPHSTELPMGSHHNLL
jgi:hypothetical protein